MPNSARLACGCCVFLVFAVIPSSAGEDIKPKFVLQKSHIFGLSISPDGKMLAIGSEDDRVTLFDLEQGKEIRFLGGLATSYGDIRVAFSPDGKTVATIGKGSWRNKIVLFPVAKDEKPIVLDGKKTWIDEKTPDRKYHLTLKFDKSLEAEYFNTMKPPLFSPDGKHLARVLASTRAEGEFIRVSFFVWDIVNRKPVSDHAEHEKWIRAAHYAVPAELKDKLGLAREPPAAVSADNSLLAVSTFNISAKTGMLDVYDVASGKRILSLPQKEKVRAAFSPDGAVLATGGIRTPIHVWEMPKRKKKE